MKVRGKIVQVCWRGSVLGASLSSTVEVDKVYGSVLLQTDQLDADCVVHDVVDELGSGDWVKWRNEVTGRNELTGADELGWLK
jgi:hypothetical protein